MRPSFSSLGVPWGKEAPTERKNKKERHKMYRDTQTGAGKESGGGGGSSSLSFGGASLYVWPHAAPHPTHTLFNM